MAACEKCWNDAYIRMIADSSKSQVEHYYDLLSERKYNPCDEKQQNGNNAPFKVQTHFKVTKGKN